jgi:YD repeat-containing protein
MMLRILFAALPPRSTQRLVRVSAALALVMLSCLTAARAGLPSSVVPTALRWQGSTYVVYHSTPSVGGMSLNADKDYPTEEAACRSLSLFYSGFLDTCSFAGLTSNRPGPGTYRCNCGNLKSGHTRLVCIKGYRSDDRVCLPDGSRIPVKNDPGPPSPQACAGNPIDAGSGNKYQQETDYAATGSAALAFVRHYNSSAVVKPGSLGPRWRSHFDRAMELTIGNTLTTAYVYRPEGKRFAYTLINASWTPDADIDDKLTRLPDGGWQYAVAADRSIEHYDTNGKLVRTTDRNGASHTLAYDAQGRLTTVSDAFGRSLGFE